MKWSRVLLTLLLSTSAAAFIVLTPVFAGYASYQGYSYGSGAVRTLVKPKRAEVYVDGYYAGIVDDFDGTFQKLYLPPGEHVIELRLEGYQTFRQLILVTPSHTQKVHHEMLPLDLGDAKEPDHPEEPIPEETREDHRPPSPPPPPPEPRQPTRSPPPRPHASRSDFGILNLRVQPPEAQVRIDGEVWGHLGGMEELSIHLPAGRHWIELLQDGQAQFSTEVEIELGQTTPLNVRLSR